MTTQVISNKFVAPARFDAEKLPSGVFLSQLNYDGVRFRAGLDGNEVVIHAESDCREMYRCVGKAAWEYYRDLRKYPDPVEPVKERLLPVLKSLAEKYPDETITIDGVFLNMEEEERRASYKNNGMKRDRSYAVITDVSIPGTYNERLRVLLEYISTEPEGNEIIKLIKSKPHINKLDLDMTYAWYVKNGYLTALVKDPEALYGEDHTMRYYEVYLAFI